MKRSSKRRRQPGKRTVAELRPEWPLLAAELEKRREVSIRGREPFRPLPPPARRYVNPAQ